MVATIESGQAERTFYAHGGIIVDGWNGYRNYDEGRPEAADPHRAWGGFYRNEPGQMAGWSLYLAQTADDPADQLQHCGNTYGFWFVWEAVPMVWGYFGRQEFYTEKEAREFMTTLTGKNIKRVKYEYSDISGMHRVTVEATRSKPKIETCYRARVAA